MAFFDQFTYDDLDHFITTTLEFLEEMDDELDLNLCQTFEKIYSKAIKKVEDQSDHLDKFLSVRGSETLSRYQESFYAKCCDLMDESDLDKLRDGIEIIKKRISVRKCRRGKKDKPKSIQVSAKSYAKLDIIRNKLRKQSQNKSVSFAQVIDNLLANYSKHKK